MLPDDSPNLLASGWYFAVVCPRCGANHKLAQCPQVKSIEYAADGLIKRVEFHEGTGDLPLAMVLSVTPSGSFLSSLVDVTGAGDEEE